MHSLRSRSMDLSKVQLHLMPGVQVDDLDELTVMEGLQECIRSFMALKTALIYREKQQAHPDTTLIQRWENEALELEKEDDDVFLENGKLHNLKLSTVYQQLADEERQKYSHLLH